MFCFLGFWINWYIPISTLWEVSNVYGPWNQINDSWMEERCSVNTTDSVDLFQYLLINVVPVWSSLQVAPPSPLTRAVPDIKFSGYPNVMLNLRSRLIFYIWPDFWPDSEYRRLFSRSEIRPDRIPNLISDRIPDIRFIPYVNTPLIPIWHWQQYSLIENSTSPSLSCQCSMGENQSSLKNGLELQLHTLRTNIFQVPRYEEKKFFFLFFS